MIPRILLLLLTSALYGNGNAQTCCSGGVPISNNLGLPTGEKGSIALAVNQDINVLKTLKTGSENLEDNSRVRQTYSTLIQAGYSISAKISFDVFISFVRQERTIRQLSGRKDFVFTQGLGDAVILIKYQLTKPQNPKHELIIAAGPKLPTGSSTKTTRGIIEGADLQPGSGSWDGIVWGKYTIKRALRPSSNVFALATYRVTGVNMNYLGSLDYKFSNEFQANIGISDRVLLKSVLFDPSISFRFRKVSTDLTDGNPVPSTGGNWIFLVFGGNVQISSLTSINFTADLPIHANVTGTQLSPSYRLNLGLFYRFKKKNHSNQLIKHK